jgi:hypothetical protein
MLSALPETGVGSLKPRAGIAQHESHPTLYNIRVNQTPGPADPKSAVHEHNHRHAAYAAEATGLLFMAVLLLILTIIRYWREIPWSAR